ncbi:MAG: hypothetical protein ACOC03_04520, partial [Desulfosalsimonas sp.]
DTGFDESYDVFHAIGFFHNSEFGTEYLNFGFDGQGGLEIASITSSSSAGTGPEATTIRFFDDGEITIGDELTGAISPDGNFFAIGDMTDSNPSAGFGIRQTSGLYADDFMGEYRVFMVAVTSEDQNSPEIKEGILDADGKADLSPAPGTDLEFSAFYYIDDETGRLSIEPEGTYDTMDGALSADGRIFAAVDADKSDGSLLFIIGMRIAENGMETEASGSYYVNEFTCEDPDAPAGRFFELFIDNGLQYEAYEIDSTMGSTHEMAGGYMVVDETGRIEADSENGDENLSGATDENGDLLVLQDDELLSIGIRQTPDSGSDSDSSDQQNDDSSAGCFIGTLLQ